MNYPNLFLFILLLIWTLIWKGLALWKAARLGDKKWFIAILVLNTVGILEILYVYYFSEKRQKTSQKEDNLNNEKEIKKDEW